MLTTTIKEILIGTFRESHQEMNEYRLYLFFESEQHQALYVGQSKDVLTRVESHLGVSPGNPFSPVGQLARVNMPRSYDWYIQFLTIQECVPAYWMNQERMKKRDPRWAKPVDWSGPLPFLTVDDAERGLIGCYNPCLNVAYRSQKSQIPAVWTLPHAELPEGLTFRNGPAPIFEYVVFYDAFDFIALENRRYTVTVKAPDRTMCRARIVMFLGYEPERLSISMKGHDYPLLEGEPV